jgi:UDP-MurNAc hydroxylase
MVEFNKASGGKGVVTIALDGRLLKRLLTRQMNWNNAEIGSLLKFARTPDVYDRGVMHHLAYFHVA